jgi:hypothetical protein
MHFMSVNLSKKCYILTRKDCIDRACNKYTEYKKHIQNFNKKMTTATTL